MMTLCAPYARMKLQMNPMRLSFVTSVDKVMFLMLLMPNTEQSGYIILSSFLIF